MSTRDGPGGGWHRSCGDGSRGRAGATRPEGRVPRPKGRVPGRAEGDPGPEGRVPGPGEARRRPESEERRGDAGTPAGGACRPRNPRRPDAHPGPAGATPLSSLGLCRVLLRPNTEVALGIPAPSLAPSCGTLGTGRAQGCFGFCLSGSILGVGAPGRHLPSRGKRRAHESLGFL